MTLDGVLFLSSHTARSNAYVQAMVRADLAPQWTAFYGEEKAGRPGQGGDQHCVGPQASDLYYPDFGVSAVSSSREAGWEPQLLSADRIADEAVASELKRLAPKLVIFCGYGGEIVPTSLLDAAPFLHIHAGWLPEYRGSTTGYYSLLETGGIAATAILLDKDIDTGVILMRQRYPAPSAGTDIDYVYDPAIRADLLVRVMRHLAHHGSLPASQAQGENGRTFYVIHPVLKHLALLMFKDPSQR